MHPEYRRFIQRLRDTLSGETGLGRLSPWIEKNTYLKGAPFSFRGHEYQRAIVDDTALDQCGIKPRQVGFTEVTARMALGFIATTPNIALMVILPHVHKALKMIKSRFDPIINTSTTLSAMLMPGSDSSSFKVFGSSQLIAQGSYSQIISDPIDIRIIDEYDFCDPGNLLTSDQTMDHSQFRCDRTELRGIRRSFSTPTVPGAGVSALYEASDQKRWMVKAKCGHWVWPTFLENVVVNGWDRPFKELTKYDIQSLEARGLLTTARILCPECREVISLENLTHSHREWVAAYPGRPRSGFHINPFDLPFDAQGRPDRTPTRILRQMEKYGTETQNFYNHVLGLGYADATNSVSDTVVEQRIRIKPIPPEIAATMQLPPTVMGIDVGKVSYVWVGIPRQAGSVDVIWGQRLHLVGGEGEDLADQVSALIRAYRCWKLVIDAYPYQPSVLSLQGKHSVELVIACDYFLNKKSLQASKLKEDTGELTTHRTRVISAAVKKINTGQFNWPMMDEMKLAREHFQAIRKVKEDGALEEDAVWVNDKPDHYAHAAVYLNLAAELHAMQFGMEYYPTPQPRGIILQGWGSDEKTGYPNYARR